MWTSHISTAIIPSKQENLWLSRAHGSYLQKHSSTRKSLNRRTSVPRMTRVVVPSLRSVRRSASEEDFWIWSMQCDASLPVLVSGVGLLKRLSTRLGSNIITGRSGLKLKLWLCLATQDKREGRKVTRTMRTRLSLR